MSDYKNKTAIISGGAEGIGFSIALAMGKEGMNVVLGDIDEAQLAQAEVKLKDQGSEALLGMPPPKASRLGNSGSDSD